MNLKESFDYIKNLSREERQKQTVYSILFDEKRDRFVLITLLMAADKADYDDPQESAQHFLLATHEELIIGSCEGYEQYYKGMTLSELTEDFENSIGNGIKLESLTYKVLKGENAEDSNLSELITEYTLSKIFPELLKFAGCTEMESYCLENFVSGNKTAFKDKAVELVASKFARQ